MLYHIIKLTTIPKPVFAHTYSCPGYECQFGEMVPNHEILYIESGDLTIDFSGETIVAKEGSFLILPHKYRFHSKSPEGEMHIHYTISAMVDPGARVVNKIPKNLATDEICLPFCLECGNDTRQLLTLLNKAISEYQNPDEISRQKCGILYAELLCDLARCTQAEKDTKSSRTQDVLDSRIKIYIQKNLHQKITLADVADATGKNANYLNQVFKKKNNMSIISYANLIKMKHVATLLVSEKVTIKDAAAEVGITDISYLSRLFKSKMGMTISEFKSNSADYTFSLNDLDKIRI